MRDLPRLLAMASAAAALACSNGADGPSCPPGTDVDPHPAGWVLRGSPRFHGTEARTDTTCVCCHPAQDASSLCVACHAVGGPAGSVHLPDFVATHDAADVAANGLAPLGGGIQVRCLACHTP
jgi:hypothetical protein